jgi:hypothetical protein
MPIFKKRSIAGAIAESFAFSWHNKVHRDDADYAMSKIFFPSQPRLRRLRVGTDCSGIEAPIKALDNMNIPFHRVFANDIDPKVRNDMGKLCT